MHSERTSPYVHLSHADVFALLAPYMRYTVASSSQQQQQQQQQTHPYGRWPLALLAASPAARVVAEMQHARHVVLYNTPADAQRTAVLLSDTVAPLHKVQHALNLHTSCATHATKNRNNNNNSIGRRWREALWRHVQRPLRAHCGRWRVRLASIRATRVLRHVDAVTHAIVDEHNKHDNDDDDVDTDVDSVSSDSDVDNASSVVCHTMATRPAAVSSSSSSHDAHYAGVRIGDMVMVLVSPAHLLHEQRAQSARIRRHRTTTAAADVDVDADKAAAAAAAATAVSHVVPAPTLRTWLREKLRSDTATTTQQQQQQQQHACTHDVEHDAYAQLLACLPRCSVCRHDHDDDDDEAAHDGYLFTTTTTTRHTLALPEAARYDDDSDDDDSSSDSDGDSGDACVYCDAAVRRQRDDDCAHAHVHKTAQATYTAWLMACSRHCRHKSSNNDNDNNNNNDDDNNNNNSSRVDDTLYRRVFVRNEDAITSVLLGVSRWWLQRPVRAHELPTLPHARATTTTTAAAATATKTTSVVAPLHIRVIDDVFALHHGSCVYAALRRIAAVVAPAPLLPLLLLTLLLCVTLVATSAAAASTTTTTTTLCKTIVGVLCWLLALFACAAASLLPQSLWRLSLSSSSSSCAAAVADTASRDEACVHAQCAWLHRLAVVHGRHTAALDVSHTSVTGTHLLAYALGLQAAAQQQQQRQQQADTHHTTTTTTSARLRALDLAECRALHVQYALPATLQTATVVTAADSHVGRALALLSTHSGLRLLMAAGSSVNDAALAEVGEYALLHEAAACARACRAAHVACNGNGHVHTMSSSSSSSLLAVDLTSCDDVTSLNALAYVPTLLQVMASYTAVDDEGVHSLHGASYARALARAWARYAHTLPAREHDVLQQLLAQQQQQEQQQQHDAATAAIDARLRSRLRTHLYHLDLYYCSRVTRLDGLRGLCALQYLTLSHTRVTSDGVAAMMPPHRLARIATTTATTTATMAPPLRVLVAEACDHVDSLDGMAHMQTLRKLYVRSGTLGDRGLCQFARDNHSVVLLDLSFCEALQDVSALAPLRTLHTLVLDSTDLPLSGLAGLHAAASPSLHVLSLRFCSAFALIGDDLRRLRRFVVDVPTLRRYVYADGVGDAERRAAALRAEMAAVRARDA